MIGWLESDWCSWLLPLTLANIYKQGPAKQDHKSTKCIIFLLVRADLYIVHIYIYAYTHIPGYTSIIIYMMMLHDRAYRWFFPLAHVDRESEGGRGELGRQKNSPAVMKINDCPRTSQRRRAWRFYQSFLNEGRARSGRAGKRCFETLKRPNKIAVFLTRFLSI